MSLRCFRPLKLQSKDLTMSTPTTGYKPPPKKHQPRGLKFLFEDEDIIVVEKATGLLTVGTDRIRDNTAYFLLNNYVRKGNHKSRNRVFIVHRLDRDTSGVIVFAKNEPAKRYLQDQWQTFNKKYYAVVVGRLPETEGTIKSYLAENKAHKMYSTKNSTVGKLAETGFKVINRSKKHSLLEIELRTGRKNQIRVHLSEKGFPVCGDRVYGKDKGKRLALHSAFLSITHPVTHEAMTFESVIPPYFETLVKC